MSDHKSPMKKNLLKINYKEKINFENIRKAIVFKPEEIKEKIIAKFNQKKVSHQLMLAYALKFSISGTNMERMVPIEHRGKEYKAKEFMEIVEPKRGADADENTITVNRYCAAFADEISEYLRNHPEQVRMRVAGVEDFLSFPHNYYMKNLTYDQREQCIMWLTKHDEGMLLLFNTWRPLATKALLYFKKNYDDYET